MSAQKEIMGIFGKARAFWEARVLLTAAELDIFSLLTDGPKTAGQVSESLSSDPRGTETLLNALVALEVLGKDKGAFRVKPGLEKVLSSSAPETVLPMLQHMAHLWDTWGKLTEIVLKGKKEDIIEAIKRDEKGLNAFILAMHSIGRGMAKSVVAKLDLSGRRSLLDVGGGSGVYTIAMLQAEPEMRATIFDLPLVTEIAKKKLAEEDLLDRVTLVKGDFYKDALPGGHDIALLSAIIHQNSPEQNAALYRKIFDALIPGGAIVIRDHVMNNDHAGPADGAMFAINMLVNTPGGSTYSFDEIKEDLLAAGFTDVNLLHQAEMDSLVVAEKPA